MIMSILFVILSWFCFSAEVVPLAFPICATVLGSIVVIAKLIIFGLKVKVAIEEL